jgi:hypothetical protein
VTVMSKVPRTALSKSTLLQGHSDGALVSWSSLRTSCVSRFVPSSLSPTRTILPERKSKPGRRWSFILIVLVEVGNIYALFERPEKSATLACGTSSLSWTVSACCPWTISTANRSPWTMDGDTVVVCVLRACCFSSWMLAEGSVVVLEVV